MTINTIKGMSTHTGIAVPLDIGNIDTDAIIPKQFLQRVTRDGFGKNLFHEWRFLDDAGQKENPKFILNEPIYQGASILLARENFGCGSSREHAPWALADYGFKVVIASSFADIFYGNAINNQLVPISLTETQVDTLFDYLTQNKGASLTVNLLEKTVTAGVHCFHFEMDSFKHHCLLNGLDLIGLTLQHQDHIAEFEKNRPNFLRAPFIDAQ